MADIKNLEGMIDSTPIMNDYADIESSKLPEYRYADQIKDICPNLVTALLMGGCIYFFKFLPISSIGIFIVQIITGTILYILISKYIKNESYVYLIELLKGIKDK